MKRFKITKGHNLKLDGQPSDEIIIIKDPSIVSFHPSLIKILKQSYWLKKEILLKLGLHYFMIRKMKKLYL